MRKISFVTAGLGVAVALCLLGVFWGPWPAGWWPVSKVPIRGSEFFSCETRVSTPLVLIVKEYDEQGKQVAQGATSYSSRGSLPASRLFDQGKMYTGTSTVKFFSGGVWQWPFVRGITYILERPNDDRTIKCTIVDIYSPT